MNNNQVLEQAENDLLRQPGSRWFVTLARTASLEVPGYDCQPVANQGQGRTLYLGNEINSASPLSTTRHDCSVIFDGALVNARDLRNELGDFMAPSCKSDAELILAGYQRWGEDLLGRLRGTFALVIWDSARDTLLCARDPLGSHPLFYAQSQELLVSPSISVLLEQPGVSNALNRAAMADHLMDRYPRLEETFYEKVSRVPPGHVLRVRGKERHAFRYWDPAPDRTVNWLAPDEVGRFDELLDQAVDRCLSLGPAGIFLSGGLDSVSVAAVIAERTRAGGLQKPWALSLIFPDPKENEEIVQRSVAAQLGLPQVVKPFFEATGVDGLLDPALKLCESLPAPLMNTWLPAYYQLAREGSRRGCQSIITGGGGDEWLTISPFLAADLLRDGDLAGVYRLWQSMRRSLNRSSLEILWRLLWNFGAEPLVVPPVHRVVAQFAPWALKLRHRLSPRPPMWVPPKWLAPGLVLRDEMARRREEEDVNKKQGSSSFYISMMRTALEHPVVSWELEEMFEVYHKAGVRVLQPFWDADLVDMLYRTPPLQLIHDGRNKGLVRASLARRFPNLGFERQRKMEATTFYSSLIYQDASKIWKRLGGARTLVDMGIVDEETLPRAFDRFLDGRHEGRDAHRVWSILNLETWARAHVS